MNEKQTDLAGNSLPQPPERGNEIRERPILFSGAMVRAILEGRKTMTRRVVKPQPHAGVDAVKWQDVIITGCNTPDQSGFAMMRGGVIESEAIRCPYGQPGDRLWVREAWRVEGSHTDIYSPECIGANRAHFGRIDYEASITWNKSMYGKLRPSIHMPRWASRITLEVTGVRVERLHEITEEDARAEGISDGGCVNCGGHEPCGCDNPTPDARDAFIGLWLSINGRESWDANPWVWVVEFRRVEK